MLKKYAKPFFSEPVENLKQHIVDIIQRAYIDGRSTTKERLLDDLNVLDIFIDQHGRLDPSHPKYPLHRDVSRNLLQIAEIYISMGERGYVPVKWAKAAYRLHVAIHPERTSEYDSFYRAVGNACKLDSYEPRNCLLGLLYSVDNHWPQKRQLD